MDYENNTEQTRKQMADVERYLTDRFGSISPEWGITLTMLADNLDLLEQCKADVRNNGIYDPAIGKKNPLLATIKDLQNSIMAQAKHLGITPWAAQNIHADETDDANDFVDNLTK